MALSYICNIQLAIYNYLCVCVCVCVCVCMFRSTTTSLSVYGYLTVSPPLSCVPVNPVVAVADHRKESEDCLCRETPQIMHA